MNFPRWTEHPIDIAWTLFGLRHVLCTCLITFLDRTLFRMLASMSAETENTGNLEPRKTIVVCCLASKWSQVWRIIKRRMSFNSSGRGDSFNGYTSCCHVFFSHVQCLQGFVNRTYAALSLEHILGIMTHCSTEYIAGSTKKTVVFTETIRVVIPM